MVLRVLMPMLLLATACASFAESRHALVIANGAYPQSIGPLTKTYDDADTMAAALRQVGFAVDRVRDGTREDLLAALSRFTRSLRAPDAVGFLYFAGHGAAQQTRGENFIIPVAANVQSSSDLSLFAVSMSTIMEAIETTRARASFVVIDACRNVAFTRGSRGLIPVSKYNDMIIAFSTKPGDVAADNGVYADVLARAIQQPGLRAEAVFNLVQEEVSRASNREQVPWAEDGLIDAFYFAGAPRSNGGRPPAPSPVATVSVPPPEPAIDIVAERFRGIVSQSTGVHAEPDRLSTRFKRLTVGEVVTVTGRVRDRLYFRVELEDGREGYAAVSAIERF